MYQVWSIDSALRVPEKEVARNGLPCRQTSPLATSFSEGTWRTPVEAKDFSSILCIPTSSWVGTGSPFPGVKRGRGVTQTTYTPLVPRSRMSRYSCFSHPWRLHGGSGTAFLYVLRTNRTVWSYLDKCCWKVMGANGIQHAKFISRVRSRAKCEGSVLEVMSCACTTVQYFLPYSFLLFCFSPSYIIYLSFILYLVPYI
jgi:hypothetical protein